MVISHSGDTCLSSGTELDCNDAVDCQVKIGIVKDNEAVVC